MREEPCAREAARRVVTPGPGLSSNPWGTSPGWVVCTTVVERWKCTGVQEVLCCAAWADCAGAAARGRRCGRSWPRGSAHSSPLRGMATAGRTGACAAAPAGAGAAPRPVRAQQAAVRGNRGVCSAMARGQVHHGCIRDDADSVVQPVGRTHQVLGCTHEHTARALRTMMARSPASVVVMTGKPLCSHERSTSMMRATWRWWGTGAGAGTGAGTHASSVDDGWAGPWPHATQIV
jgi:hypothetical protein